jgi:hypothetical protein
MMMFENITEIFLELGFKNVNMTRLTADEGGQE